VVQAQQYGCWKCGALPGHPCMSKTGKPTKSHAQRGEVFPEVTAPISANEASDQAMATFREINRKQRVDQIIWAIQFARGVMKVPQEQIDLNMAEMVVDAELDLKLF